MSQGSEALPMGSAGALDISRRCFGPLGVASFLYKVGDALFDAQRCLRGSVFLFRRLHCPLSLAEYLWAHKHTILHFPHLQERRRTDFFTHLGQEPP